MSENDVTTETIAIEAVAVETAHVRSSIHSRKIRPRHGDSVHLLVCDFRNGLLQRSDDAVDITNDLVGLICVVNLTAKLCNDVGLRINL